MDITELHELILKELECPVCLEYMKPPITICQNGHNICFSCKPNLYRCPTCRQQFLQVRSLSLECLARNIMYPCTNKKAGCPEVFPMQLLSEHQARCYFGDYKCPFSKISKVYCTLSCSLADLKRHVLRDHRGSTLDIYGGGNFYSHLSPLTPTASMSKALVVFGKLFYAVWKVIDGDFCCTVIYVGPQDNSTNFSFRFTITARNKIETISTCLITRSYNENVEEVLKPGNCIAIHYDTIEKFFAGENKLPFQLEISRLGVSDSGLSHNENDYNANVETQYYER